MRIDHVTVAAPVSSLARRGFTCTPTARGRGHARVFLDRFYVAVTPGGSASSAPLAQGWYVRPPNIRPTAQRLSDSGVCNPTATTYRGHDGIWLDIELSVPGLGAAAPRLTRRLGETDLSWPPPLRMPHPNCARRLLAVHVRTGLPDELGRLLSLLEAEEVAPGRFALGETEVVLHADDSAPGGVTRLDFDAGQHLTLHPHE